MLVPCGRFDVWCMTLLLVLRIRIAGAWETPSLRVRLRHLLILRLRRPILGITRVILRRTWWAV